MPTPGAFSGGVLSTAGDLVFQGQADGYITAYSAVEGRRVWAFYSATAALGAPISFAIGKRQYISILNGPTQGAAGSLGAMSARFGWDSRAHPRRLLTFVLDGTARCRRRPCPRLRYPWTEATVVDEALAKEGAQLFAKCQWCHGAGAIAGGGAPDLRASLSPLVAASFASVVRGGVGDRGMPKFEELTDRELDALRHYIRARARKRDAARRCGATRARGTGPGRERRRPGRVRTQAAAGFTRVDRHTASADLGVFHNGLAGPTHRYEWVGQTQRRKKLSINAYLSDT